MALLHPVDPLVESLNTKLGITMEELDQAVARAMTYKVPQQLDWEVTSGQNFLKFASGILRWIPHEGFESKEVYMTLCLFYFILNQSPLDKLQTPVSPSKDGHTLTPLSQWMIDFASKVGRWMDRPESLTPETLQSFRESPQYRVWEAVEPKGGWRSFNDFFARHLQPGARPISFSSGSPTDDLYICHSADCTFNGSWPVDGNGLVKIKNLEWSISDLLAGSDYAEKFAGGMWMHGTLNTCDYHRQHAPVRGTIVEAKVVPGLCRMDVAADPSSGTLVARRTEYPVDDDGGARRLSSSSASSSESARAADNPDDPGYAFLQARGIITIDHPTLGYVTVLPVGMALVSSVVLSVVEGQKVEKGDELSYFQFGGSDLVVVFEEKAKVNFDPSQMGEHYFVGQTLARAG